MEAGAHLRCHPVHPQPRPDARYVEQGDKGLSVGSIRVRPVGAGLAVALFHRPKQLDGLVDQVGAEVVEDSAAFGERGRIAPVPEAFRPPPFKTRLERPHLAQGTFPQQFLQRQEVGVPPSVLEDRELHTGVGRAGGQLLTLGHCDDERLVHHNIQAAGDCGGAKLQVR
jgi:hypothetical protein